MPRKKINGVLLVLAKLLEVEEDKGISILRLQELTGIKNYYTINRHLDILKELGFIEEEVDVGPPARRLIKLTERGRQAAQHARELLRLAGLL